MNEISALIKTDMRGVISLCSPSREDTARKHQEMNQEACSYQTPDLLVP